MHHLVGDRVLGATRDELRLHARFHQSLDAKLRRLGLLFAQDGWLQDVGKRYKTAVFRAFFKGQFAQCFNVEAVLVVARGAAHFNKDHIAGLARVAGHCQLSQSHLDGAGDVRNHLHIAAEVSATAFAFKNFGVDLTGSDEVQATKVLVEDTLIGAQIHVGFKTVFKHEHFAVAIGVQRAAVDIQVTLHLDGGDGESFVFQKLGEGT